ncbi:hypothetical protein ACFL6P_01185 [Candidatus Latescibacterota bacterium]
MKIQITNRRTIVPVVMSASGDNNRFIKCKYLPDDKVAQPPVNPFN